MNEKPELRYIPAEDLEVRAAAAAAGEKPMISGYAARFNQRTTIGGLFEEQFTPGCFTDTLRNDDCVMVWNHNPDIVLGRMSAGTLRCSEDEKGLMVENDPPEGASREVEAIRRKDVRGMSVRMVVQKESWEMPKNANTLPLRTIQRARLIEVSPTAFPAYKGTDIAVRSSADVLAGLNSAAPPEPPAESLTVIRERFEFMHRNA